MRLRLSVQYAVTLTGAPAKSTIRRWALTALKGSTRRRIALGVRLVGAAESASLNARFRRRHHPTNVLAFPFEAPPGVRSENIGDLVICAPVVSREARLQNKPLRAHWAHIVVHGILHLRGYDHQTRQQATVMEKMETRILLGLGYADPYLI
ncbi:MAG: rRNA maturation RNase YbeY [Sulfuricaulis sp.]